MESRTYCTIVTILLLILIINTISSQESEKKGRPNQGLVFRLSEQDVILPITAIEWGYPDRWSFTSRYIHGFHKEKKRRMWDHNLGVFLSPGLSGGRLGIGYLGIYSPASLREFALFSELRGILLRTWGNPLSVNPNETFWGAELKICISWLLNASVGYYLPIKNSTKNTDSFLGFHVGIGI
ncbi:MAG: hypothetical protein JSW33_15820 [bacterium]|nr:MAG: hypothetical protein JSW33_15820 [bacterium]